MNLIAFIELLKSFWRPGHKRRIARIADLERRLGAQSSARATAEAVSDNLARRLAQVGTQLRVAENRLLALGYLCSGCTVNVHLEHTQESGCPVEGCVCLIRDSDPPAAPEPS